ncbi:MAG: nucleotidyltransferase domain-containing protein [Rickettsiales bacterium]|nr:nucleotidyltransferase domain-containing protein [Rickettsiales bacterium]
MFKYKFIQDIAKLPFVNKIILFGSRSREDNEIRSDIDLAIDCLGATIGKTYLKV